MEVQGFDLQCTKPKLIRSSEGLDYGMYVPCGRCMACRISLTREWTTRLMHESYTTAPSCFLTLTYRDECLPLDRSLNKRVVQLFIKRLRKQLSNKIKYYAVGEYGDENLREHYHLIIFGWRPIDLYFVNKKGGKNRYASRLIDVLWPYGFNTVGHVEHDSIQYVVGYVRKKLYGMKALEVYGSRLPPFSLQSKGLGLAYAKANEKKIIENLGVVEKGKNIGLPRYYRKKLDISSERLYMKSVERQADIIEQYIDLTPEQLFELVKDARCQREKNLKALAERKML